MVPFNNKAKLRFKNIFLKEEEEEATRVATEEAKKAEEEALKKAEEEAKLNEEIIIHVDPEPTVVDRD